MESDKTGLGHLGRAHGRDPPAWSFYIPGIYSA
jgi:hypothetical protein